MRLSMFSRGNTERKASLPRPFKRLAAYCSIPQLELCIMRTNAPNVPQTAPDKSIYN